MHIREVLALAAILCASAAMPLSGQQARDSARFAAPSPVKSGFTTVPLSGPRLSPPFQRFEASLVPTPSNRSSLAAQGGQHTIVISTLALVLAVIIVVLLAAN